MDPEFLQQILEAVMPQEPAPRVASTSEALFLSRLARPDVTRVAMRDPTQRSLLQEFRGRESELGTADETHTLEALFGLASLPSLFRSVPRLAQGLLRRGVREGADEGGSAIGQLQRELRERRSGEAGRRGAPREGPRGRRASDVQGDRLMGEAEGIVARDIIAQALREAELRTQAVDPIAELVRLLNPPGS